MNIYNNISEVNKKNLFVTAGVFDGLHLGHRHILDVLKKSAKENNVESAVITFWPHPLTVVLKNKTVKLIDTLEEKIKIFEILQIDNLIILPFTKEFAALSAKEFIKQYLKDALSIEGLIVGYDHKFGNDKLNDMDKLREYADECGFSIIKTGAFSYEQETLSSTLVRKTILDGEIERTNKYLSRQFVVSGKVVDGHKIGRSLGFPTANIQLNQPFKILPKEGVYAVEALIDDKFLKGMLNIGIRPTFNSNISQKTIELHIFDFKESLYDKHIKIVFHKYIRDEIKFDNKQLLISQLKEDEINVKRYFH